MSTEIKFKGLDEFSSKLQEVIKKYPNETEVELMKLGRKLRKIAQDKTPKKTGKLKKSYKLSNVEFSLDGNSFITMTNTSPHYHLVERGHKIVTNRGSKNVSNGLEIRSGKVLGFAPGVHMVENSVTELDNNMQEELDPWVDKLLEEAK